MHVYNGHPNVMYILFYLNYPVHDIVSIYAMVPAAAVHESGHVSGHARPRAGAAAPAQVVLAHSLMIQ